MQKVDSLSTCDKSSSCLNYIIWMLSDTVKMLYLPDIYDNNTYLMYLANGNVCV